MWWHSKNWTSNNHQKPIRSTRLGLCTSATILQNPCYMLCFFNRGVKYKIMAFQIQFRGQRIDNNEWVYGYYVKDPKGQHRIYWQPFDEASSNTYHFVKEESIGQMWKPSEGLTLFTGDLLHAECSPSGSNNKKQRLCKIVFEPRGMNVSVWHKGEWWAYGSMNFTTAKVIGNVVDNPELLGVTQHSI